MCLHIRRVINYKLRTVFWNCLIDLVLRVWSPTLFATFVFVAQIPGSISAEGFHHSKRFISMEYCHDRHKFENKQDKREEQVGDLSDGEMSGEICHEDMFLFIFCFCGSDRLDLWKLQKSLQERDHYCDSWLIHILGYIGRDHESWWILATWQYITYIVAACYCTQAATSYPCVRSYACALTLLTSTCGSFCHLL